MQFGVILLISLFHRLIHTTDTPTDILILEDLSLRSYSTENPKIGLNLEQSKMALEKLAFFHAASVIILNNVSIIHSFTVIFEL